MGGKMKPKTSKKDLQSFTRSMEV